MQKGMRIEFITAIGARPLVPNIKLCVSTKSLEITDAELMVEDAAGIRTIPADTVIFAIGQKLLQQEALSLSACAPEFYQIGDSVTPKNIYEATTAAHQVACDIGRY